MERTHICTYIHTGTHANQRRQAHTNGHIIENETTRTVKTKKQKHTETYRRRVLNQMQDESTKKQKERRSSVR